MEDDNPCKEMTTKWKEKTRIQKTSTLKKKSDISKEFQFPKNRDVSTPIPSRSPQIQWTLPKISKELPQKADKSTPPNILKTIAYETIDRYPQTSIKAYTDGSAEEATKNGGYGSFICIPQRESPVSIYGPCGRHCNNYEADGRYNCY